MWWIFGTLGIGWAVVIWSLLRAASQADEARERMRRKRFRRETEVVDN